jgi:hypothetical protein
MWDREPLLRQARSHLLQALGWLRPPLKVPNMRAPAAHPPRLALRAERLLRQEVSHVACLEEAQEDAVVLADALGDEARARGMAQFTKDTGLTQRRAGPARYRRGPLGMCRPIPIQEKP